MPGINTASASLSGLSGRIPEFYDPEYKIRFGSDEASIDQTTLTWRLPTTIDLDHGENRLQVRSVDNEGNTIKVEELTVRRIVPRLDSPEDIALNSVGMIAYIIDADLDALVSVELSSGDRELVSQAGGRGAGTGFDTPEGVVLSGDTAYVVDSGLDALVSVELSSGDRELVSQAGGRGAGTGFDTPEGVVLSGDTAYVVDSGLDALVSVELSSGNRGIVSQSGSRGSGTGFDIPEGVALNSAGTIAYIIDAGLDALVSVELSSGNREIISQMGDRGAGVGFNSPQDITLNSVGTTAYVIDFHLNALVSVELSSGDREIVSQGGGRGTGRIFEGSKGIALNPSDKTAYVVNFHGNSASLSYVELSSGNRTIVSDSSTGTGNSFKNPKGLALNPVGTRAYVIDDDGHVLFNVELSTGDRMIISDSSTGTEINFDELTGIVSNSTDTIAYVVNHDFFGSDDLLSSIELSSGNFGIVSQAGDSGRGTGPAFSSPGGVTLSPAGTIAYIVDAGLDALVSVRLSDGNRTIVSQAGGSGRGTGPAFDSPQGIALNTAGTIAYVIDSGLDALVSVQLSDGNRTIVSQAGGSGRGTGPAFDSPRGIVLNPAGTIAYVIDSVLEALVSVQLSDGNRTIVSDNSTGTGDAFGGPLAIALNPSGDAAYVLDNRSLLVGDFRSDALLSVNLSTGDRFIVSQYR